MNAEVVMSESVWLLHCLQWLKSCQELERGELGMCDCCGRVDQCLEGRMERVLGLPKSF